jgi:hypothetical protein
MVMNARVTGDPPAPRKVNPAVPVEVEELILHAMERDPKNRYQTALEMKAQLEDTSLVKVTGRHHHLQTPRVWSAKWHSARLMIFSAAVPILLFITMFLVTRCHHPTHHP